MTLIRAFGSSTTMISIPVVLVVVVVVVLPVVQQVILPLMMTTSQWIPSWRRWRSAGWGLKNKSKWKVGGGGGGRVAPIVMLVVDV